MLGDQSQQKDEGAQPPDKFVDAQKPSAEDDESKASSRANIKRWINRITKAKEKWASDFKRMRDNMDFVYGLQWRGQKNLKDERVVVNMTMRTINQRVATLYARDPKVVANRRKRLDFQLWDGKVETIQQAIQSTVEGAMNGQPVNPQAMALLQDFNAGRQRQQLVEKVGKTLELAYQYQQDSQEPGFKKQMKQLVRRVSVCGVGYVKVLFCRDYENELTQSETRMSVEDRVKQAQEILKRLKEGKLQESSPEVDTLRSLVESFSMAPLDSETVAVKEHLIFDFPQATSIIPDPSCRMLKGFVGARWVAEEFSYSVDFVNAFYEKDIKPGMDAKEYGADGKPAEGVASSEDGDPAKSKCKLWQVYDLDTKSTFVILDGYKDYLQEPESMTPATKGFWQIVPVTFNDIEVTDECKATIFPPSDVDLIRSSQVEHNRCRNSLKKHRIANRPRYVYPESALTDVDLDAIAGAGDQEFVPLKGLMPGTEPGKVLQSLQMQPIQPELYDTKPMQEDAMLSVGMQEANMGPAQPNVTATVGNIAEQSRVTVAGSDIDSLDDALTDIAKIGGEMMLREMSTDTIHRTVGPGAVWPEQDRENFINGVELEVVAASSGRPNKMLELGNWEKVVPMLIQAAQLPPQAQTTAQAVIRETVRRMDDRMEPADFFPLPVPQVAPEQPQQSDQPQGQGRPVPKPAGRRGGPVPLAKQSGQ